MNVTARITSYLLTYSDFLLAVWDGIIGSCKCQWKGRNSRKTPRSPMFGDWQRWRGSLRVFRSFWTCFTSLDLLHFIWQLNGTSRWLPIFWLTGAPTSKRKTKFDLIRQRKEMTSLYCELFSGGERRFFMQFVMGILSLPIFFLARAAILTHLIRQFLIMRFFLFRFKDFF